VLHSACNPDFPKSARTTDHITSPTRAGSAATTATAKQKAQGLLNSHTCRARPFEEELLISALLFAAPQAAHACPHPVDFLQNYSFHSRDCGFSGWTRDSNSNFSSFSFVSQGKIEKARWTERIDDGQGEDCSKSEQSVVVSLISTGYRHLH
jgi:hypothetical protein